MDRRALLPILVAFVVGAGAGLALNLAVGQPDGPAQVTEASAERRELEALRARVAQLEAERLDPGTDSRRPAQGPPELGPPGAPPAALDVALARLRALDPERFARMNAERLVETWELDLSRLTLGVEDLQALAALPNLAVLNLASTGVGDAELAALAGLTSLESVNLSGAMMTDAGLAHLAALERLEEIDLSSTGIGDAGLGHLSELTGLSTLHLTGTQVSDDGLLALTGLDLKRLSIGSTAVTDAGLAAIESFDLEALSLYRNTNLTDAGFTALATQAGLRDLNLRGVQVSADGMTNLAGLGELETLNASLSMDDAGMEHLARLASVKNLMLYSNPSLTDAGGVHLEGLTTVERLSLQNTGIGDGTLAVIDGLPSVRFVDLRGTNVTPEAVAQYRTRHPGVRVIH